MMQFGLTQFGKTIGAVTLVSASALAQADLAGHNEVTKLFSSTGQATATVSGYGRRVANTLPATASAQASANTARAKVTFNPLPTTALATAIANTAKARVDFSAYSLVDGYATAVGYGDSRRLTKIYPLRAQGFAEGTAEAQTWQMAYAEPAVATASGYGTTYHLAYGNGVCSATLYDSPRLQIGAAGTAYASAALAATGQFQIGGHGLGVGEATVNGDPAIIKDSVRHFEVHGDAMAFAIALAGTVGITQAQTGTGVCTAQGSARFNLGGKGVAVCVATGTANPDVVGTGATGEPGNTSATATGWAKANRYGKGSAACSATGYGSGQRTVTKQYPLPANAFASAVMASGALRTSLVAGTGLVTASAETLHVQRDVQLLPGEAFAALQQLRVEFQAYPQVAGATATLVQTALKKSLYGAGLATATAQATGFNEVNDLVPAPAERTITVEVFPRLVIVEEQPRLILV